METETKKEIRARIHSLRDSLGTDSIIRASHAIAVQLFKLEAFINAGTVFMYSSYGSEVRTDEIIKYALESGKTVALPRVISASEMEFAAIDRNTVMKSGYRGIKEPEDAKAIKIAPDIMVIPGIAFDENCSRIGHGKGYYDRYISSMPRTLMAALSFDEQVVQYIPAEPHDRRMDMIITPTRIINNHE